VSERPLSTGIAMSPAVYVFVMARSSITRHLREA
jgi:hypothetical protein